MKRRLRRILREAIEAELSQEDEFVEKINDMIVNQNEKSYDQAVEFLRAMPELLDHPDLMIYGAHDNDDYEVFNLNGKSSMTKQEAMSFTEHGGEPVELVSSDWKHSSRGGLTRWFEYRYLDY